MSRFYEMVLKIKDYRGERLKQIEQACRKEWHFAASDFICERAGSPAITVAAQDYLYGGEGEQEFAERLVRAVWKANGGFCWVSVQATFLESLPYETYTFSEKDYERMKKR